MLLKDFLEIVSDREPAFYRWLFLVGRVSRGWRPVNSLASLNVHVMQISLNLERDVIVLGNSRGLSLANNNSFRVKTIFFVCHGRSGIPI